MPAYLREVLPRAPIRLLYDLHRTARDYPAEVEAYVGAWDESGATLAEGARFIAGLKSKTDVPSIEAAPMQAAAVTVARQSVVEGKRGSVRVDLGGRRVLKKKT